MSSPLYTCQGCGAQLSLAQLRGTDCPFCRAAFPHHARAVEHAALVREVMVQNLGAFAPPPTTFGAPPPVVFGAGLPVMHDVHAHVAHVTSQVNDAFRRTTQLVAVAVAGAIALAVLGVIFS